MEHTVSKDLSAYLKPPVSVEEDDFSFLDNVDLDAAANKLRERILNDEEVNKVEPSNICEGGGCTI